MVSIGSVRHLWALRSFEAAARRLSFQKAAEELHLTPSAVSHQIRRLEQELGRALFVREPRTVRLTPAGITLQKFTSRGFSELARGLDAVSEDVDRSVLRVTVAPSFAAAYLTSRIAQFEHDNASLRLKLDVSQTVIDLEDGNFDVAIRLGLPDPKLHSEVLLKVRAAPVCSPAIASELKTIEDMQRFTRIVISQASTEWRSWHERLGREDLQAAREVYFTPMMDALQAAVEGVGIIMVPIEIVQKYLDDGRLVMPFTDSFASKLSYLLVCRKGEEQSPRIAKFRTWLHRAMREQNIVKANG